ncbi:MAG: single-stranded-DNA-specific exonuclease RecJ [Clostridia bacterium]|nr:single-stranded-DNA-specific exonuclease RecJ [Clostridia bacterium]
MRYVLRTNTDASDAVIRDLSTRFGFSRPFAAMLARRGLADDAAIESFLHPESGPLPDPFAFADMDRAVSLIRRAIEANERICVYGDYDTDGVCATAILTDALRSLGANVIYLLPSRQGEGYGLNRNAVDTMRRDGVRLIVTVDNGISAHGEIAYAKEAGMDTVVTDHHRCHETLPGAAAVVCASRADQDPALKCLCGTSVAMLLASALGVRIAAFLPVAALATMADVVPLTEMNRAIVRRGLPLIGAHPGLSALLDAAGVSEIAGESTLSFILAPRINAAGRMGDAERAVRLLLLTDDEAERKTLAAELEGENVRRRAEEMRILKEAEAQIDENDPRILVLCGTDWNTGVIGIVASRLVERFRCPVLLFSEVNGVLIGSGRSVPAVDLFQLLTGRKELLLRFGGHRLAAGATIEINAFETLKTALQNDLSERFPLGLPEEACVVEDRLALSEITPQFARELQSLAPFGEENRAPLFLIEGTLSNVRTMGRDGAHLGAKLSDAETSVRFVSFGNGDAYADWSAVGFARAYVSIELGSYMGRPEVSVFAQALARPVDETKNDAITACLRAIKNGRGLPEKAVLDRLMKVPEAEIRAIFRTLLPRLRNGALRESLSEKEQTALLPLCEIGVAGFQNGRFYAKPVQEKKQIHKALLYPVLCLE